MPWKLNSSAPSAARKTNCTRARVEELGPSLTAMESDTIVPSCATGLLTDPPGGKVPTVYAAACGYTIAVLHEWATTSTAPLEIPHEHVAPPPPRRPLADHPRTPRDR